MAKSYSDRLSGGEISGSARNQFSEKPRSSPDFSESKPTAQEAMQGQIELLVDDIAGKAPMMLQTIMRDLKLAGAEDIGQIAAVRARLKQVGISEDWPRETIAVIRSRLEGTLEEKKLAKKNERHADFHSLFKN